MQYIEPHSYSLPRKAPAKRSRKRTLFVAVAVSIGLLAVLFGGFIVLAAGFLLFTFKHSDAHATGRKHFVSHPAVIADLGSPIRDGLIVTGSLKRVGAVGGHADLSFSLSGPKGAKDRHTSWPPAAQRAGPFITRNGPSAASPRSSSPRTVHPPSAPRTARPP